MNNRFLVILILTLISCKDKPKPYYSSEDHSKHFMDSIKQQIDVQYSLDSMKKAADQQYLNADALVLLADKVIFDPDFSPTLVLQLRNNMKEEVKSFEILLNSSTDSQKCETFTIRKKMSIPSGKTVTVKEKLTFNSEAGCLKIENATAKIGNYVLADGTKTNDFEQFLKNAPRSN